MPGGTPSYVAPEQALGERLDQRADQYSLGAVAYAALTGRSPHQVDGLGAAGRVEAAPPPSSLGFDIPDKVDAAIVRALDPDREKRWPDIASFTRELVGALNETTHSFAPGGAPAGTTGAALPTTATDETEVGEKTALSDSNAPTVIKTGGATTVAAEAAGNPTAAPDEAAAATESPAAGGNQTAAGGEAAAASQAAADAAKPAAPQPAAETAAVEPKRRRGRWVVAALLALTVGAGAGFGGQRYLESQEEFAKVSRDNFSVELPRDWATVIATSTWRPPGTQADQPALRVSQDNEWSKAGNDTPGVFVGLMNRDEDLAKVVPDPKGYGCKNAGALEPQSQDSPILLEQISENCADGTTLLQRVVTTGVGRSMFIQVQVPGADRATAIKVADTVAFSS